LKKLRSRRIGGVATGFDKLDKLTSWQPSDLIIIAARPAMGKPHLYYLWRNMAIDFTYASCLVFS
jgi:replicative DNA helicase